MARAQTQPRQADVTRAVKGAIAAGFDVGAIEIGPDGGIRIVRANEKAKNSDATPFDSWKASRED